MRSPIAYAAVALALALAGCNEPCKGENVDVQQETVPAACSNMAPSTPVTLEFDVCVRCNNSTPSCNVDAQPSGILLDPVAEACDEGGSCPLPSCGIGEADRRTVRCTFTAPASNTTLHVFDVGQGKAIDVPLTVAPGGATTCT